MRTAKQQLPVLWLRQKKYSERSHARTSSAPPSRFWCISSRCVGTSAGAAKSRASFAPTAIADSATAVRRALRKSANSVSVYRSVPTGARSKGGVEQPNANTTCAFGLQKESRLRVPPPRSSNVQQWLSQSLTSLLTPPWQRGSHMKHRRNRSVVRFVRVRPHACAPSRWPNSQHAAARFVAREPRHD